MNTRFETICNAVGNALALTFAALGFALVLGLTGYLALRIAVTVAQWI